MKHVIRPLCVKVPFLFWNNNQKSRRVAPYQWTRRDTVGKCHKLTNYTTTTEFLNQNGTSIFFYRGKGTSNMTWTLVQSREGKENGAHNKKRSVPSRYKSYKPPLSIHFFSRIKRHIFFGTGKCFSLSLPLSLCLMRLSPTQFVSSLKAMNSGKKFPTFQRYTADVAGT